MYEQKNVEVIYDFLDTVSMILYEKKDTDYISGIIEACNIILNQKIELILDEDDINNITMCLEDVNSITFKNEEIRKGIQLAILKGFKHKFVTNEQITPDTIGIFIGYLVDKFYDGHVMSILDPLSGTGNLLSAVVNSIKATPTVYGVDNNENMVKLSGVLFDMLNYDGHVFMQDTFTFGNVNVDLIVTDMHNEYVEGMYMPYALIIHHMNNLIDGGYFISIINNDFFEHKKSETFKKELSEVGYMIGIIKLPDSMFKGMGKSIFIIRKKGNDIQNINDFLIVDLPSFEDIEQLDKTVNKINNWFTNRK